MVLELWFQRVLGSILSSAFVPHLHSSSIKFEFLHLHYASPRMYGGLHLQMQRQECKGDDCFRDIVEPIF